MDYSKKIIDAGLKIKAFEINFENPFTFVSGYRMPFYINNREFLWFPEYRKLITEGFKNLIESKDIPSDIIAGVVTSGIPFAESLADSLEPRKHLIYVRSKPKEHGTKNQIEGIPKEYSLEGKSVVLIEDLFSLGTSSTPCVLAIRKAGGICNYCLSIVDYGFEEAEKNFKKINCQKYSLVYAKDFINFLNSDKKELLKEWRADPMNWGEKHGFPRIQK